ncbi:MAG: D-lyxose/D-mannose family sugar isomerase [Bacteroidetes bacterium]|nr:D-lyxose/D-mannose family sugar isomerase [Bacteroidota bacterium]MDA1121845.1 D-lyxose/D-mannose family sugar isomerase [Bacteroidota bacterium]
MKRSEVNKAVRDSKIFFENNHWVLPPEPKWDVTDFGLGDLLNYGLVLINLAEESEYCEKLMYATRNQKTPAHTHKKKKEDIICRNGILIVQVWKGLPDLRDEVFELKVNGQNRQVRSGEKLKLMSGERVTLTPGIYHEFYPESEECIISEVSTANDDLHDNFFVSKDIGRFSSIEEDEPPLVDLVSD